MFGKTIANHATGKTRIESYVNKIFFLFVGIKFSDINHYYFKNHVQNLTILMQKKNSSDLINKNKEGVI